MIAFKQTCDKPYNRHRYKVVYTNKEVIFDDYEDAQVAWFQSPKQFLSHIEVLDLKQKSKKGFK